MKKKKILIVEDNLLLSKIQQEWLKNAGYEVKAASNEPFARHLIHRYGFDLILSDVRLPEGDGISLLEWIRKEGFGTPFVVMTEYASTPDTVRAVKLGAADYLNKPVQREQLTDLVHAILKTPSVIRGEKVIFKRSSAGAREVERQVALAAPTDISILITGSSGSGKESVAQSIHQLSGRRFGPFVAVDCGAIPRELLASEFFGHVKGAFTGADTDKKGYFDVAQGGTLFLDEIGNMPYELQTMLLRTVQEHVYSPVGSRKQHLLDVRIVSATNENLADTVREKRFRADLYHRLAEFDICLPDLCECPEDILPLAHFFFIQFTQECGKEIKGFAAETERAMLSYSWPGNVRELCNRTKRGILLAEGRPITVQDMGLESTFEPSAIIKGSDRILKQKNVEEEKEKIIQVLKGSGNNITWAAELLGISRTALYNKLRKYNLKYK